MYIPPYYKENDRESILSYMRNNSFATVVTGGNEILATHLPFLIEESEGELYLLSHLSAVNPHKDLLPQHESLVIFQGAHGYISPFFYDNPVSVPTWNYIAVHARGKAEIISGKEENLQLLEKTISTYEKEYLKRWKELPDSYLDGMIKGIVSFRIKITSLEGKAKMSQNKTQEERTRMVETLSAGSEADQQLAKEIKKRI